MRKFILWFTAIIIGGTILNDCSNPRTVTYLVPESNRPVHRYDDKTQRYIYEDEIDHTSKYEAERQSNSAVDRRNTLAPNYLHPRYQNREEQMRDLIREELEMEND